MKEKFEVLQKIVSQMEEVGMIRSTDDHWVMWHWGIAARNIMVSRDTTVTTEQNDAAPEALQHDSKISLDQPADNKGKRKLNFDLEAQLPSPAKHQSKRLKAEDFTGRSHLDESNGARGWVMKLVRVVGAWFRKGIEFFQGLVGHWEEQQQSPPEEKIPDSWVITGVIDWDGILSVPLVVPDNLHFGFGATRMSVLLGFLAIATFQLPGN